MGGTAYSVDVTGQNVVVEVSPEKQYSSPALCIRGTFGSLQLLAANEHLAEIEFALRTYLDGIRYSETPDQQAILIHEINQSIEEGIA
ncbi:hypothetical protein KB559_10790 [Paenibacillus sp. Marseille-P2973]|uniref:hypothetical protein n=1 Tax=Paenibacillus sp. Marseille-P2973 TaxID=1871032 RepID=UPI001B37CEBC|nr:hypothetical protein [Paenibacillus sp. Marseille-P2973]MBQ4899323.1 hypothetical protein [Paenibacillus sp. Marseille-P2973]